MIIVTERLELKQFATDDVDFLYELDNNKVVNRYRSTDTRTMEFCESQIKNWTNRYSQSFLNVYKISLKDTNVPVGLVHLVDNGEGQIELGCRQLDKFWGKGYMIEAFNTLIEMYFEMYTDDIYSITSSDNSSAKKLMKKLGFKEVSSNNTRNYCEYRLTESDFDKINK